MTKVTKKVIVTGASRGIGKHTAIALAQRRCELVLIARSEDLLEDVARQSYENGAAAVHAIPTDLVDPKETVRAWIEGWARLGWVDVLINNAGFNTRRAPFDAFSLEEWDDLIAVNLRAPFILSQQAIRDMGERGSGRIVNVLSTASHHAIPFMAPYVAAKMGLLGMTRVLALEASQRGVKVSSVSPGATDSAEAGLHNTLSPESVGQIISSAVFGPQDIEMSEMIIRPRPVGI